MSKKRSRAPIGRPRQAQKDENDLVGCLWLLAAMSVMAGTILLAIYGLAQPSYDRLGPWLDAQSAWTRAGVGVVAGSVLASPALLLRFAFFRNKWFGWPLALYLFTCWIYVTVSWLPPKSGDGAEEAIYRHEAGWYIPTSLLTFHVLVVLCLAWAVRLSDGASAGTARDNARDSAKGKRARKAKGRPHA